MPDIKLRSASPILNNIYQDLDIGWTWDVTLISKTVSNDVQMLRRRFMPIAMAESGIIKVGGALSELTANGIDIIDFVENGVSVSILGGSGIDVSATIESGIALSTLAGSGIDNLTSIESGLAISSLIGSGVRVLVFTKAGIALSIFIGAGNDIANVLRIGNAIAVNVGAGSKAIQVEKLGGGQLIVVASGIDAETFTRIGVAITSLIGAGSDVFNAVEICNAITLILGEGTGKIYEKSGMATLEMTCCDSQFVTQHLVRHYGIGITIAEEGQHPINMMPEQVPHLPFETVRASDGIEEQNQLVIAIVIGLIMARSHRL